MAEPSTRTTTDKKLEWLKQFTGIDPASGADAPGGGMVDQAARFEARAARQAAVLKKAFADIDQMKAGFQDAMSTKLKGGARLLDKKGGQMKEIDFTELDAFLKRPDLDPQIKSVIADGSNRLMVIGLTIDEAQFQFGGQTEPLFTREERQTEFWTRIMRERILPETLIGDKVSETQQMIDATNEAYFKAVDVKAASGGLTPAGMGKGKILATAGRDVLALGGTLLGPFAGDAAGLKLAQSVLETSAKIFDTGMEIYDKLDAREYAASASGAIDLMGLATGIVLAGVGVDDKVVKLVESSFTAGSKAIMAGKAFAEGEQGTEAGLALLGEVFANAFSGAAGMTDGKTAEGLKLVSNLVPAAFAKVVELNKLRQQVADGDFEGIIQTLGDAAKSTLVAVQGSLLTVAEASNPAKAKELETQYSGQTERISSIMDSTTAGALMAFRAAVALHRGEFEAAIEGLIDDIGKNLSGVLKAAGLPAEQAATISELYASAASGPKAVKALLQEPPKVEEALKVLADGVRIAFKDAAPGNEALAKAGDGFGLGIEGLASAIKTVELFNEKKYEEGIHAFVNGVEAQLGGAFKLAGVGGLEDGKDGASKDGGGAELEKLRGLILEVKTAAGSKDIQDKLSQGLDLARESLDKKKAADMAAADRAEAEALLAEADADITQMSAAQTAGAAASNIDRMIAKVMRDQMIFKLATQIAEGGTAFLAKFVPALGAVSVAVKLAANLYCAGKRAKQVYEWTRTQDDLEAAQSALSTSAQNFLKNQSVQLLHYSLQATAAAVELAGEITKLSGVAALPGQIVSAVGSGSASLETIIMEKAQAYDLESAWDITVKSMRNPGNRKFALQARAQNPTLAKYAIAWGAVTLKDPLARNAMRACDLDEATLSNEGSNVDKVVSYLETFYEDDKKLYRELDPAPDWAPKEITLTRECWGETKRSAREKLKGVTLESGAVDGPLTLYSAWLQKDTATKALEAARTALKAAQAKAAKTKPGDGKTAALPVAELDAVRVALLARQSELKEAELLLGQLRKAFADFKPGAAPASDAKDFAAAITSFKAVSGRFVKQAEAATRSTTQEWSNCQLERLLIEKALVEDDKAKTGGTKTGT